MAVEQEPLSPSVIPLFKLDLDGTLTAAIMVQFKKNPKQIDKDKEQLTYPLPKWQQA